MRMKDKEGVRRRTIMREVKRQSRKDAHRHKKTKGGSGAGEERIRTRKFRLKQSNTSLQLNNHLGQLLCTAEQSIGTFSGALQNCYELRNNDSSW